MAPRDSHNDGRDVAASEEKQFLFIIRHGDRWDYAHPEWVKTTDRRGDPPLSRLGHQQARETGIFLDSILAQDGIEPSNITWLSSPFLRTLQTSNDMLNAIDSINTDHILIHPEDSVWEMDGHNGEMHKSLPPIHERKHYFPRLDINHTSLFTPSLPEGRDEFLGRADRAVKALHQRFSFQPRSAIVIITHAAACVGLTRAAANCTLQDVNPAGPCGVFRLTRTSNTDLWDLDHFGKKGGLNGHLDHLSDMGVTTYPWNHFGDKKVNKGYTGPPVGEEKPEL